jgi:UDP-2-acetamido-2,6-beta-L-arabino-hexul-4-ose reductase
VIIGSGDVAQALPDRDDLTFFASGVSDSSCTDEHKYDREVRLLLSQDSRAHIVYFSSLAVFFSDTRYTQHKRYMETLIRENFPTYTIVRIGNIDWGSNPHTLINYLRAHPKAKVKDEYRYVVDKDEFLYWVDAIPPWNCEMNVVGERLKVKQIREKYCVKK